MSTNLKVSPNTRNKTNIEETIFFACYLCLKHTNECHTHTTRNEH